MESLAWKRPPLAGADSRMVLVYDIRSEGQEIPQKWLETSGLDLSGFVEVLRKEFTISPKEKFELATTDRIVVDDVKFNELKDESTLYVLRDKHQDLPSSTAENIKFTPHHHTLTEGGLFEYHSSVGNNALSAALAELIDNSLSATAKNTSGRAINIEMVFDGTMGKPAMIVTDNGCGMTSKKLNNWAVYKLSKFSREDSMFLSQQTSYVRPDPVPRSLNSDISFFGVGGKHAVFFIGDSVRMISKPAGSPDVHELVLSKEGLQRKEMNKEDVFKGIIKNRKPGDSSHLEPNHERFLHQLIAEEYGRESFTSVIITGIRPQFINFVKNDFAALTRQLAHIHHYYIHGANGHNLSEASTSSDQRNKIDILVSLRERHLQHPRVINLRDVEDDMQTLYISSTVDTFEFRASTVRNKATVEGLIRYHPFLYDKETYPQHPHAERAPPDEDESENELNQARGTKPIFECFWNGRLIPSTTVPDFDWCKFTKGASVPAECYNRLSGVLFSDDGFQVTQSKLMFTDLELRLREKETIFTTVHAGQKTSKRGNIQKEFTQWLLNCHERYDKQVKFMGCGEPTEEADGTKKKQLCTPFSSIEWDDRKFKAGQRVKTLRTRPIHYGTVVHFLLRGIHKQDVYATGGQVKIILEPKALYDTTMTFAISKIDKTVTNDAIKKHIDSDALKLPKQLKVEWPEGNPCPQNATRAAGTPLGPLKIEILNGKGEPMSKIPSGGPEGGVKMSLKLSLFEDGNPRNKFDNVAQHLAKQGFWFKKLEGFGNLGKHTLTLNAIVNENSTTFGGQPLPSYTLKFTIKAGHAERFAVGAVQSKVRVGMPFSIPLEIGDRFGHPTEPPPNLNPRLTCSDLELSHEKVQSTGSKITILNVTAKGKIPKDQRSESYELKVTLPGLREDAQTLKIDLLPGVPNSLYVTPKEEPIPVENGNPVMFHVEVHDEVGNITANPRQAVRCRLPGAPVQTTDCSSTGAGQLSTKPINVKIIKGKPEKLEVVFEMPSQKAITPVRRELLVLPSTRVKRLELSSHNDDAVLVFKNDEKIEWLAGCLLENLFYKLYDEAGRDVELTPEIASKIKVNWTRELNETDLVRGKLPDLQVPQHVHEERFYQVSYQDQSVSVSFTIVPRPDEATELKVTLCETSVQLGETLTEEINLELVDQYGNETGTLIPSCMNQITVEADGLDESAIDFKWKGSNSSVVVTGVRFQAGALGPREIWFKYRDYRQRAIVNVTAGLPAKLALVSKDGQSLQFLNAKISPTQFDVQLFDKWGNISNDQRVVVELTTAPPGLQVFSSPSSQGVSSEGKASFIVKSVSGPKGYYQLTFQGSLNQTPIESPSVNFTVIPNPNQPVRLSVHYDTAAKYPAGGVFPVFSVTVVSDEGSPMTTFNPGAVAMLLWEGGPSGDTPPEHATQMRCSRPLETDNKESFHFREKQIPEHVGKCSIQFSLKIAENEFLFSHRISINVVANQPFKLGPDTEPPTPIVSSNGDINNRTLVKGMTLRIRDSFGNPAGQDLNGTLVISIVPADGQGSQNRPLFEANHSTVKFKLEEGKTHIPRLAILKKSPGQNGSKYTLVFKPEVLMFSTPLAPFELSFDFYNSADNTRQMSQMTKRKSELTLALNSYKDMFSTYTELLQMLTNQLLEANQKENDLRNELSQKNFTIPPSASSSSIDRLIREKAAEAERIGRTRKRVCKIPDPFRGGQDVLGKVGHLALLEDDDAARVISWVLSGQLDCVVTTTTEAAQKIYRDTRGSQQVMALDSVYVSRENRPLPHIRNGRRLFNPPGNPVMARELLIYPQHQDKSEIVFKNFLGDTILMDDLNSANLYRRMVVQNRMPCPTIITRDGDRVNAKGTFGGAQNKAPPMDRLKLLGAPFPESFHKLAEEKELLTRFQTAVAKREKAEVERTKHLETYRSSENQRTQHEMKNIEGELQEIERHLESLQAISARRRRQDLPESSGIPVKRARK